jgi:hypothetical protein
MELLLLAVFLLLVALLGRIYKKIQSIKHLPTFRKVLEISEKTSLGMMIIFGSGGHTAEMLFLIKDYDFISRCKKIYFVRADTDILCENKVKHFLEDEKVISDYSMKR